MLRSKQDLFDFVLGKMREQGGASYQNEMSRYRCPSGRKCPIGHLISDDLYRSVIEGSSVETLAYNDPEILCGTMSRTLVRRNTEILDDLQQAHDFYASYAETAGDAYFMRKYEERMENIADTYRLKYEPPATTEGE